MERPTYFRDKIALRFAFNESPVIGLMPCVQRTPQPTYKERLWLLMLFLTNCVFLQHLALLYGPICRHAYNNQCGEDGYERLANTTGPRLDGRRLDLRSALEGVGNEFDTWVQMARLSLIGVLSGKMPLNCELTKCDHWEQVALDGRGKIVTSSTPRLNYFPAADAIGATGTQEAHKRTYTFLYWPGMCRCQETYLQKLTFRIAVGLSSVVFQTILINALQAVLKKDWESRVGWRSAAHSCVMGVVTTIMLAEMMFVYLLKFVPKVTWMLSMVVSGLIVLVLNFVSKFTQAHFRVVTVPQEFEEEQAAAFSYTSVWHRQA